MAPIDEKRQPHATDRRPEVFGQYDNAGEVETYATYSQKSFAGWIERRFIAMILRQFHLLSNLDVLDVATGPAWIPLALAKVRPDWNFTATDASPLMLEKARAAAAAYGVKINLVKALAEKTTFPSERFDLIICHFALHEFPKPEAALQEMARLLKPGGRIVIQDLQRPHPFIQKFLVFFAFLGYRSRAMASQYKESLQASYRAQEVRKMMSGTGLDYSVEVVEKLLGGLVRISAVKPKI